VPTAAPPTAANGTLPAAAPPTRGWTRDLPLAAAAAAPGAAAAVAPPPPPPAEVRRLVARAPPPFFLALLTPLALTPRAAGSTAAHACKSVWCHHLPPGAAAATPHAMPHSQKQIRKHTGMAEQEVQAASSPSASLRLSQVLLKDCGQSGASMHEAEHGTGLATSAHTRASQKLSHTHFRALSNSVTPVPLVEVRCPCSVVEAGCLTCVAEP
jgi:hypothetical protein